MSYPQFPGSPEGYPPGYGFPAPTPKKSRARVRMLVAVVAVAGLVLGLPLFAAWIKPVLPFLLPPDVLPKVLGPNDEYRMPWNSSGENSAGTPSDVDAPQLTQPPQLPGAITMPPGVDPALVANGGTDHFLSTSKYLFPDKSEQERLDLGHRACIYTATAMGTPVQVIAGLASTVGLAKYEAAALAEVATANLCPQYRSKVMLDGSAAPAPAPAPAPTPAPAPAGADPIVPQPPLGPGITTTDYRPEAIKPYLESVMTQPGLAGFSKQTLIDMGAYACGYLSAYDDTPQNLEAGVAAGLSLSRADGARIADAAASTMCTQFRGKVGR